MSLRSFFLFLAVALLFGACEPQQKTDSAEQESKAGEQKVEGLFSAMPANAGEQQKQNAVRRQTAVSSQSVTPAGGNTRLMELPATTRGERVISHTGYMLSFNTTTLCPNWVAWELTASETRGHLDRSRDFFPDDAVPSAQRVTTSDYSGSGYTRGHMCPAADMEWGAKPLHDCFLMSNMCPQTEELNRYSWEALERACRRWARKEGAVLIVCGPIFDNERKQKTIGRKHKVRVPDAFFKCVLSMRKGHEKGIAFIYKNNRAEQDMKECATTVDAVEQLTGYNFFVNVSDALEERLERQCNLSAWH